METCIALFRGINVGGNNMVPMKELRSIIEREGCGEVRTYIQSGNAVFGTAVKDRAALESCLTAAIAKRYGFEPRVLILTVKELERAAAANPFPAASDNPGSLHLFFLVQRPDRPDLKGMAAIATSSEGFALKGKVFYLHTPDGFGRSKLAGRVEQLLGVRATARNWRTVTTLLELAKGA